ncbi:chorismate-binding protein [Propioniciclava soli]|uniref:isochorismate synthase n=1 Tax=Propioniciclava soli TaxID=2775081 RepID=A0ABZ3C9L3_9ACTN
MTTGRTGSTRPARARRREPFATSVRRGVPLVWATGAGDDLTALLGWGERFRATAAGPDRFATLAREFRRFAAAADADPHELVAFVTLTFAAESAEASTLIVPEVVGRWAGGVLTTAEDVLPEPSAPAEFEELDVRPGQLSREAYRRAVAEAVRRISGGEVAKVVLARDLEAVAPDPVDVPAVVARLQEANPEAWTFHVDGLVGASPELLVALHEGRVRSRVLAGSAPVTGDPDADAAAAAALAASPKDRAEHAFAARSVVDPLAQVADVTAAGPAVLRQPRIWHLATDVSGTLHPGSTLGVLELAGLVHPTAAVCGAPTDVAAALLAELEGFDRGRYAGPVGWVDAAGDGEFALALRCGQVAPDGRSVRLFAGGGVVAASSPSAELAETAQKFLPMYEALSPVARP